MSLALDLMRATYEQQFEVAIIVSQASDFGHAVRCAKEIAQTQGRRLTFESACPVGLGSSSKRGTTGTMCVRIDKETYDSCLDLKTTGLADDALGGWLCHFQSPQRRKNGLDAGSTYADATSIICRTSTASSRCGPVEIRSIRQPITSCRRST